MAKKKSATGASAAVGGKRKVAAKTNKPGRKRRKTVDKRTISASNDKRIESFYYCEGENPNSLCNLLIQKPWVQPSMDQNDIPFSDFSGTDSGTNVLVRGLDPLERMMWSSTLGANYASKGFAPANIARSIGRITRKLWLPAGQKSNVATYKRSKTMKWHNRHAKATPPTLSRAKKELKNTLHDLSESAMGENEREEKLLSDATKLVDAWKKSLKHIGRIHPNWNQNGELSNLPVGKNTSSTSQPNLTASVATIRKLLESKAWSDDTEFATFEKELYHLTIPTDTLSVLRALETLAKPDPALYGLPLVLAIPVLEPMEATSSGESQSFEFTRKPWKLTIAVYAHRLLFECMTRDAMRIVMAALDDDDDDEKGGNDDGCVARSLVQPPSAGPIVFGKDPNTKVEMVRVKSEYKDDSDDSYYSDSEGVVVIDNDSSNEDLEGRTRTDDTLDAFSTEGYLKLIENQGVSGVDTIYKTKIEQVLYGGNARANNRNPLLQVSLLPHQIHGVCWMYQMETLDEGDDGDAGISDSNNPSLGLNGLLWERRRFHEGDCYYYSPALGQARLSIGEGTGTRRRGKRGGILADEMGLGKTVQALALVLSTLGDLRKEQSGLEEMRKSKANCEEEDEKSAIQRYSHATLIIVPPALVSQWIKEINKIAGTNVKVQFLDHKQQDHRVELDPLVDIVLTTYQVMESGKKSSRQVSQRRNVSHILSSTSWGRIILDEMQEVRSWNTTVSKACQELKSDRRWMLSGTPLWEGINDFKGELCFLGLEPFAANNEDGFFDFAVANHWKARSKHGLEILRILGLVMLRRTKSMSILESGLPLLGLKNLTLVFEPVPQDPPERAMYCFLESVMHSTLKGSNGEQSANAAKKTKQNRLIFLRLLRELCVSPYLINGGFRCSSQLTVLNRLMKEYNRIELETKSSLDGDGMYSCDEAIQFLSQVEDMARTDSDFVTDTRLGGGGGISRRNRALLTNPQERIDSAKEQLATSTEICREARSTRAKARWHMALEGVTTGRLVDKSCYKTASPSLVRLWNWRKDITLVKPVVNLSFLNRGFRPTDKYFGLTENSSIVRDGNATGKSMRRHEREEKLFRLGKQQADFRWAHPFASVFSHIPIQLHEIQIRESIENILESVSSTSCTQIIRLSESSDSETWEAIVQFAKGEDFDSFERCLKKADGVKVMINEKLPCIEQEIAATEAKLREAEAMCIVHPSEVNERNLSKARTAHKKSKLGLRVLDKKHHRSGQILCSRAFGSFRGSSPKTWEALDKTASKQIEDATALLTEHTSIMNQQEKTLESMQQKIEMNLAGTGAENLTTIDVLQALKNGEPEKTNCPICYDNLGEGENSNGTVALTRCGHMSCKLCLEKWMYHKEGNGEALSCIECRKPISREQLIFVDPKKADCRHFENRKNKAAVLVQEAAKMLEENYGQLEPHLWEALYLVIDLPPEIDRNRHGRFTAIPGLFMGHLKHAIGNCLPIDSGPNAMASATAASNKIRLPSKFRALLADLPRNELSVVFASSKPIVLHLQCVLEMEGFGCKTLFVGQSEKESESAISDWESISPDNPNGDASSASVLIVQAGAAACGLTLTAASRMFIIEPFRKHEEEKQAYARLHRFGQKRAVSCKVYYTPVSVESRLLEWRRRAKTHASEEEKTVYAPLRHSHDADDDSSQSEQRMQEHDDIDSDQSVEDGRKMESSKDTEDSEAIAEENQTRFLLGLATSSAEAEVSSNADAIDVERIEASGRAESPIEPSP